MKAKRSAKKAVGKVDKKKPLAQKTGRQSEPPEWDKAFKLAEEHADDGLSPLISEGERVFALVKVLPGNFGIYKNGEDTMVVAASRLNSLASRAQKNRNNPFEEERKYIYAESAVSIAGLLCKLGSGGGEDIIKRAIGDKLTLAIGEDVLRLKNATSELKADVIIGEILGTFEIALNGIKRLSFPAKVRGSREKTHRVILAQQAAADFCRDHYRMPSIKELREKLEAQGITYAGKGVGWKWRELFEDKAGLTFDYTGKDDKK